MSNWQSEDIWPQGIYEQLANGEMTEGLKNLAANLKAQFEKVSLDDMELMAEYVKRLLLSNFSRIKSEKTKAEKQDIINLQTDAVNDAISAVTDDAGKAGGKLLKNPPELLAAIWPDTRSDKPLRPDTPLAKNAIFTGGRDELQVGSQLVKEIETADEIYLIVSFIRWSGLDILMNALESAAARGTVLHVVTTTYMGATELYAIKRLAELQNTDIHISYDTGITRLHAKSYVFCRKTGYHTAYVGSSNISKPALVDGFEWNVKISAVTSPDIFEKILVTSEAYLYDPQFVLYDSGQEAKLKKALGARNRNTPSLRILPDTVQNLTSGEITPYPYQESILEALSVERERYHRYRNLVVAATGTGKTVIAAFDYKYFRQKHPKNARLLFVAHRKEILEQAQETFRKILQDDTFGSLQVGQHEPEGTDHLFASVQSLNSRQMWETTGAEYYDYIVIDEAHHKEAQTYQRILQHLRPKILLGLTATPERMDGKSILTDFNDRIAAEIRLPDAIDQGLLCPFHYFGLDDTVDLSEVRWTRGGYDTAELNNLYVLNAEIAKKRAKHIVTQFRKHVDISNVHALGFCVSKEHANFMADYFNEAGIPSGVVLGDTRPSDREACRQQLENGKLSVVFCVDVFNEGVDIPSVNTILLLRPTESLTVFLQQMGRGLRLHENKAALCVLDFVGNANRNYRFEEKFGAILRSKRELEKQVKNRFPYVPRGCYIELEERPMEIVLASIRDGFCTRGGLVERIRQYREEEGHYPDIAQFLSYYHLEPEEVYRFGMFDTLLRLAQGQPGNTEPIAKQLNRRTNRLHFTSIDSYRWLRKMTKILGSLPGFLGEDISKETDLMLRMFYTSLWSSETIPDMNSEKAAERFTEFARSPVLRAELVTLFSYMMDRLTTRSWELKRIPCPLDIHCTYTRNQLLAAFGYQSPGGFQEGVKDFPDLNCEVLLITMNKDAKDYTESTLYKDYAIDNHRIHWESPNDWTMASESIRRYQEQEYNNRQILLFVRSKKNTPLNVAAPYVFLGPAKFIRASGSKPVSVIWELEYAIDPRFLPEISRAVV